MSTTLPSLSKSPNPQEIQAYLNAAALYFQQESRSEIEKLDKKENPLASTQYIVDELITSLFQKTSTEALEDIGKYLISHPDAIAVASTAVVGAPPHPVTVGVLGLMILVMSSTASSSIATTASDNLKDFVETYSKAS